MFSKRNPVNIEVSWEKEWRSTMFGSTSESVARWSDHGPWSGNAGHNVATLDMIGSKLRQSERDLHMITDAIANPVVVLAPDGETLYANRVALDQTGLTNEEATTAGFIPRTCHPDDIERMLDQRRAGLRQGVPFELELRALKHGEYRWHLAQYNPLTDESGRVIRWYATATDIDDRKKTEEKLRNENERLDQEKIYLEEQIRSEMGYEQIIGSSPTLMHVLEMVETVAPSDSTVLLLGETGTGKELIARAVHERSRRNSKTFVKLNCAAIPQVYWRASCSDMRREPSRVPSFKKSVAWNWPIKAPCSSMRWVISPLRSNQNYCVFCRRESSNGSAVLTRGR